MAPARYMNKRPRQYKRNYRKKYRNYRRQLALKPHSVSVPRPSGGVFADRYFTRVRYTYLTTLLGAGLPSAYTQVRLNGAFDPVVAAGGGQPMGWDQLSALYLRYKVHYSKIKIRATNLTTIPTYLTAYPLTSTSAPTGLESDMEQRYMKQILISGTAGGGTGTLMNGISVKRLFGQKELYDDDYEGATASSIPANAGTWNIACYTVDGSTNPNMPIAVTIEYFIEFTDPVRLGLS